MVNFDMGDIAIWSFIAICCASFIFFGILFTVGYPLASGPAAASCFGVLFGLIGWSMYRCGPFA